MAVLRNSQGQQAPRGQLPEVRQSSASAAQPDVNKHAAAHTAYESITGPSTVTMNNVRAQVPAKMMLVDALFGAGQQFAQAKHEAQMQEAYLSGIAQFSAGVAESELQASPWTRDWTTAGFRDTAGKMRLAEAEAQTLQLVKEMRESSPTEFAQVLEQRRASLLPQFEGMSRSQRGAVFAQLVTSDQAAIQKHAMAHGEFIIDTKRQAVHTILNTQSEMMQAEKGKTTYGAAVDSYITTLLTNSIMDETLPIKTRQSYLAEGIEHAILSGNPQVYEMLASTPIRFPDGSEGTVLSRLPLDAVNKLGQQYRSATSGIVSEAAVDWQRQMAEIEASYDNPMTPTPSPAEFDLMVDRGVANGAIKASDIRPLTTRHRKAWGKKAQQGDLANLYANREWDRMQRAGFNENDGAEAFNMYLQSTGMPTPARIAANLGMANANNSAAGFALMGKEIAPYFRSFGLTGEGAPTEADKAVQAVVLHTMDAYRANGNTSAQAHLLAGMSDEDARITSLALANLGQFGTAQTTDAVKKTRMDFDAAERATKVERDAAELGVADKLAELNTALEPFFMWRGMSLTERGIAQDDIAPRLTPGEALLPWSKTNPAVLHELAHLGTVVGEYAIEEIRRNPYLGRTDEGIKQAHTLAMARVARNAIDHADGKLHLNPGQSISGLFGTAPAISQAGPGLIGKALTAYSDEFIKQGIGGRVHWQPLGKGEGLLAYVHYDADGNEVASNTVPAAEIGAIATQLYEDEAGLIDELTGRGRTVRRASGSVTINGQSGTPVEPATMIKFRQNLIGSEDIKPKAYLDTTGVLTVGVGIAKTSGLLPPDLKEGDEVSQQFIDESFATATNTAAQQAWDFMAAQGVRGETAFLLFGELAYQSGDVSAQAPVAELAQAIARGDTQRAVSLVQRTRAFKYAGESRQKHYMKLAHRAAQGK